MAEDVRRSGRARQPNKKYTVDPFEGLEKALYASSDSGSSSTSAPPREESEDDVEFVVLDDAPEEEEDDEELHGDVVPSSDSEQEGFDEPGNDEVALDDLEPGPLTGTDIERLGRHRVPSRRAVIGLRLRNLKGVAFRTEVQSGTHTRGVNEFKTKSAKEQRVLYMFGPTKEDIEPVLKTRDKWLWNPTLPSRTTGDDGIGGMGPSFYVSKGVKEKEKNQTRNWYFGKGGKDAFASGQQSELLSSGDAQIYMPKTEGNFHNFVAGPAHKQKLFTLKTGESVRISEPFEDDRSGFILNLGAKILDLQWAPIVQGSTHYLAIIVKKENPSIKKGSNFKSPAYAPQLPFPASIQIWAFKALEDGTMDSQSPPYLEVAICTDWANIKELKWCPVTMSDSNESDDHTTMHLGLLAAIFGDGKLRVLDITYPKSTSPTYLHITHSAFESCPADTVFTCLTWVSSRTIAAGTAIGTVAVYTLDSTTLSTSDPRADAVPWFYQPMQDSYILAIASAYPSRPSYLSTLCSDGHMRLIDLRSPSMDTTGASRQRVFCRPLLWHEHSQSFVATDENFYVRLHGLRRFYMHTLVLRCPSFVTCAAVGTAHPILMTGSAGGEVTTNNPLRRALDVKCESWQQVWFQYEYRRPIKPPGINGNAAGSSAPPLTPQDAASQPLSRFITGHEPTQQLLQRPNGHAYPASASDPNSPLNPKDVNIGSDGGPLAPTIYEEEQAVTALAWNPNIRVGGWAAAGLGSGLVRVEDLCVQTL
ncbi:uncharacterized protein BDZ99DRAFT_379595 [Mytilinidion resinicola]|uniref:Transcription factor TFIIIC complex subunit Tfc6 n=1 Tax=Mytilinidion resinicola TaxID=574789 RepID=A0A6A6Z2D4_9PEZI|nr:uncharacterized protein BDZ99DRAFT_379595 [Mytilinidion resinicola]KAF2814454.1 hypothetical protein BDZ99DRAFT_379595 [Mytilinidion resinicola]